MRFIKIWFTAGLMVVPQTAWCHAVLVSGTPQQGSVVPAGAVAVNLRFNSRIDGRRSRLFLIAPDGTEQRLAALPQTAADLMSAKIPDARPGRCRIRWQVLASDGHITRGQLEFQVK